MQGILALLALIHMPYGINIHALTLLHCNTFDVIAAAMAHGAGSPMSLMQLHKPLSMGVCLGPLLPSDTFALLTSPQKG